MKQLIFIDDDQLVIEISKIIANTLPETIDFKKIYFRSGDFFFHSLQSLQLEEQNFLFLDLNMPGLDGWQVIDRLVSRGLVMNFKIYLLSSSIDPNDKKRAEVHPHVERFIEKPLSKMKLKQCLQEAMAAI